MKGDTSLLVQVIFATLLVIVLVTLVWNSLMVPSMVSYGREHAQLVGKSLATSINALSLEEEGTVYKELGLAWDIRIYHDDDGIGYITVNHDKFESGDIMLIGDADDFTSSNIGSIYVIKESGTNPRLQERL
jgi:hypothetical protein